MNAKQICALTVKQLNLLDRNLRMEFAGYPAAAVRKSVFFFRHAVGKEKYKS